jgi:hypothetical protein
MRRAHAAGPLGHRRATSRGSRAECADGDASGRQVSSECDGGPPVIVRTRGPRDLGSGRGPSSEERLEEAVELGLREDSGLGWRLDPLWL